ncbi:hypothetical protein QTP88_024156 [Uroleucon formosanum]
MTDEIETTVKEVLNKIISNIDYELMEERLRRMDDVNEEPSIEDLEGLLFYAKRFAGDDIIQPDDISEAGPVEMIQDDEIVMPAIDQAALEAPSDEAQFVTPAGGDTVRNSFGDSIGWLDPGTKPAILDEHVEEAMVNKDEQKLKIAVQQHQELLSGFLNATFVYMTGVVKRRFQVLEEQIKEAMINKNEQKLKIMNKHHQEVLK